MKLSHNSLISLICTVLIFFSCSKDNSGTTASPGGGGTSTCATATPGAKFSEVKNLLTNNCVTCHNPNGQQPNPNFQDNCVIQANAALIKSRAVDMGNMPPTGPLSQTDKNKISTWVAAGGRVTD